MNIKIKAAFEVAGLLVGTVVVAAGVQSLLKTATAAYGAENVINGVAFGLVSIAAYVIVGLLYDMRVAKLQYREKLNEMTRK